MAVLSHDSQHLYGRIHHSLLALWVIWKLVGLCYQWCTGPIELSGAWQAASALQATPWVTNAVQSDKPLNNVAADAALQPAVLSGGLSRGLCLINKAVASARSGGKRSALPRMLCLQGSPDATQQYIAVMNSIFAAQVDHAVPIQEATLCSSGVGQCLDQPAQPCDRVCSRECVTGVPG